RPPPPARRARSAGRPAAHPPPPVPPTAGPTPRPARRSMPRPGARPGGGTVPAPPVPAPLASTDPPSFLQPAVSLARDHATAHTVVMRTTTGRTRGMTDMTEGGSTRAAELEKTSNETSPRKGQATRRGGGDPAGRGRTTIADGVVEKIAGMAARDVLGVHAMGSGLSRTFGAVRDRVPGGTKSVARGVKAEVGEVQTALDLEIVVDYGVSIKDVARAVRENVIAAVERMTGLEVVEVNIAVSEVKLPDEEDDEEPESRLQ